METTVALIGSVSLLVTALTAAYVSIRRDIQSVHVLVNKQLSDVMDRLTLMTADRDSLKNELKG